jgi:hypothetical protein
MAKVRYFSGTQELGSVHSEATSRFLAIGGIKSKHNAFDSFSRMVGRPIDGPDAILPVTRKIFFKSNPSLHKCDARCMGATGHDCECSCGGKNHGAAR